MNEKKKSLGLSSKIILSVVVVLQAEKLQALISRFKI